MPLNFCFGGQDCCAGNAVNASLKQGETISYQWLFSNPDGTPMNLTGYIFQIAIAFPSSVFYDTNGNGLTIDALAGIVTWDVADTVTANYPVGAYSYEFFGTDSGDHRMCDFSGQFNVNQSITPISA